VNHFVYLASLVLALSGLVIIDHRFSLVFWQPEVSLSRSLITLAIGVTFFSAWDAAGIGLGIFYPGSSPFVTELMLTPGYPLEELFFLTLLCYLALILRWRPR
jgi:lycopene cyclase domain-containing protein